MKCWIFLIVLTGLTLVSAEELMPQAVEPAKPGTGILSVQALESIPDPSPRPGSEVAPLGILGQPAFLNSDAPPVHLVDRDEQTQTGKAPVEGSWNSDTTPRTEEFEIRLPLEVGRGFNLGQNYIRGTGRWTRNWLQGDDDAWEVDVRIIRPFGSWAGAEWTFVLEFITEEDFQSGRRETLRLGIQVFRF